MALPKIPLLTEESTILVREYLRSNLNLYFKDLDFQYDDGISLSPINDNDYYFSEIIESLTMPSVYLIAGQLTPKYDKSPNYLSAESELNAVITLEEIGANELAQKAWRYGRALFGTLNLIDLQTTDGRLKIHIVPQRIGYSETVITKLADREKKFRKDVVVECKLMHFEKNLT